MNRLWLRLAISFLMVTLLVITVVALVVRNSVESSFGTYVAVSNLARFGDDFIGELENYHATTGSWVGVDDLLPGRGSAQGAGNTARGAQVFISDVDGVIMAATQPDWIGQRVTTIGDSRQVELRVDDRIVGMLGEQTPGSIALNEAESQFLQEITNGLLLTGVAAGLIAIVLAILLAYSLTRPLQTLTNRISNWRLRDEIVPLSVEGTDEIRQLAYAFNDVLSRLAQGEAQRQRMSADIAHELRTPVTVMRGHLEAMMDGVYPLDAAHLAVAYDQILHLARLVEDLRLLTRAESGRLPLSLSAFDINPVMQSAVNRFTPLAVDANIHMTLTLSPTPTIIYADPHRVQQVLDNLLNNALRHTPQNGKIDVQVTLADEIVRVLITNQTDKSFDEDQVTHLFDRFWRGEDARDRDTGGSGLGLAITRELLRLQGGHINAEPTREGLSLVFTLPAVR